MPTSQLAAARQVETWCLLGVLTGCSGFEEIVEVRHPASARAETRGSYTQLSEGSSGSIEEKEYREDEKPVENRFKLPLSCRGALKLSTPGSAPRPFSDFPALQLELIALRKKDPHTPVDLTCDWFFIGARVVQQGDPTNIRHLSSGGSYRLSTPPSNILKLRTVSHAVQVGAAITALFAFIPASICGIGAAVSTPPATGPDVHDLRGQRADFTTCALIATPIAVVATIVGIVDPTIVTEYPIDERAALAARSAEPTPRARKRRTTWGKGRRP
jgi:hypothetical protein